MDSKSYSPAVSVIIAVYKAEKYIERCARSLFEQTLKDMEFIFIDDATPDNSMNVLRRIIDEYPERKPQVKIITHEHNMGTFVTKRDGYLAAGGGYVTVCDSDDYVELNTYERAYNKAIEEKSDIVVFNYIEHYADREVVVNRVLPYSSPGEVIANAWRTRFIFLLCDVLIRNRRDVIENLPALGRIDIGEDGLIGVSLFYALRNGRMAYIQEPFYHYDLTNTQSVTKNSTEKYYHDVSLILQYFQQLLRPWDKYKMYVYSTMFHAKTRRYLPSNFKYWKHTFPESNRYVMQYLDLPWKLRLVYWLMLHGFGWIRKFIFR